MTVERLMNKKCPECHSRRVYHFDLGDETDSEGDYGNHRVRCADCGRMTVDQDTLGDALVAFLNGPEGDLVFHVPVP